MKGLVVFFRRCATQLMDVLATSLKIPSYAFPTGEIPPDSEPYLHKIETGLSAEERGLWATTRERIWRLVTRQAKQCGLGLVGVQRLTTDWGAWSAEAVMAGMKRYPPAVRAWLFQVLKDKPELGQRADFMPACMQTQDPLIAEALAYALCFQPTATNAADTLAHFPSPSTRALVEMSLRCIDPRVAQLIHRLVHQEIAPHINAATYCTWGWHYCGEGKSDEAFKACSIAIAKGSKGDILCHSYIARAASRLLRGGKLRAVADDIRNGVKAGVSRGEAYSWIGISLVRAGLRRQQPDLLEGALKCFRKARKHGWTSTELLQTRSAALVRLARYVEADDDYVRLARLEQGFDPGDDTEPWKLWWEEVLSAHFADPG